MCHRVATMQRDGFLVTDHPVTTSADLARIRDLLDGLFDCFDWLPGHIAYDLGDVKEHEGRQQVPEILSPTRIEPRLLDTIAFANCRALASELLGEPTQSWFDHAISKPPGSETDVGWHQDRAYVSDETRAVHIWLPLQDVDEHNGCMQFVPGSHRGGVMPHRHRGNRAGAHALVIDDVDETGAVSCPLRAGMATAHLPTTVHRTGPNWSDTPRTAWILQFHVAPFPEARWGRRLLTRASRSAASAGTVVHGLAAGHRRSRDRARARGV